MDFQFFANALLAPEQMNDRWANAKCVLDSSLNQKMGPRDCNFFLRTEFEKDKEWKVLVDYAGPGCLTRFWTAGEFDGNWKYIWINLLSRRFRQL
jgi:hypothetical protein